MELFNRKCCYKTEKIEVNKDEVLVAENYEQTKKIIEKRLKKIGVTAYSIKYSEKTGDIIVGINEYEVKNYVFKK